MLLADLKSLAGGMGIKGASSMKKAQLVEAITAAGAPGRGGRPEATDKPADKPAQKGEAGEQPKQGKAKKAKQSDQKGAPDKAADKTADKQSDKSADKPADKAQEQAAADQGEDDEQGGSRRSRRRRNRDRQRQQGGQGNQGGQQGQQGQQQGGRYEADTQVLDDDVLVPAAGIVDVLDNYAFVRTGGYLASPDDVYLSLSMVRRYGLRPGDAVVGQVRQPREGERKEKFNPMVRIDSVNGADPEAARSRIEFATLTPVHPTTRLRLETTSDELVGRIIDLAAPVGKGQRGLLVSGAHAGKTAALRAIASAITANNPECHLMVVLVDERPEEVTDFQRSVKGEVIASTFDRQPADHTAVAELAVERAKRLVELGHDVVVLLDGLTRLGRAYNLAASTSSRGAGGIDAATLHPPKKFFGAARNIENGGSLTILATVMGDSGSHLDEVIFDELSGTSNMEVRLSRLLADEQHFPALDVTASGTRREELMLTPQEVEVRQTFRALFAGMTVEEAWTELTKRLAATGSNAELLMGLARR